MTDAIVVALISALFGGLLVSVTNHLFSRRKTAAEADKLRAETERMRAETEKVRIETRLLTQANPAETDRAMASAIRASGRVVWLMGISLRRFFGDRSDLAMAMLDAYSKAPRPDMRVLLLDLESSDARARAHFEEGLRHTGDHTTSHLYNDILATLDMLKSQFPEVEVRFYQGQMSFVLLTDETLFAELYHYSARAQGQRVPMLEFSRQGGEAAYREFRDHFTRVFSAAQPIGTTLSEGAPGRKGLGQSDAPGTRAEDTEGHGGNG